MTSEVNEYLFGTTETSDGIQFSEWKLKRRIMFFKNKHYPTGKITEDGDYEHWFDIIHSRVNSEVKNLDIDSKHFLIFSKAPVIDFAATYVLNFVLDDFMWQNGSAEELNDSVEDFSADGNILYRKTANGYEVWDMLNTFILNTTARTVDDTDIIERFYMTQSDLRAKDGLYKNVDEVIKNCGNKFFSKTETGFGESKSKKMYETYRRTGEISEKDLFEAKGLEGGDENKYVLARIVVVGLKKGSSANRYVLFAEEIKGKMSDYFIEAHRGPYKGRWFREGMYEILFDLQVRYNDISNEIARGLTWASKVLFSHSDVQTLQNIRTALTNGSLIKSKDIKQIEVRLQGFDQLVNDRNNVIQQANEIANSFEIVQGDTPPASTAFRTVIAVDLNAKQLFVFLRQKLAIAYRRVFKKFVLPDLIKDTKSKDVLRVTGDPMFLDKFRELAVNNWYIKNLVKIGPHNSEARQFIKDAKLQELQQSDPMIENMDEIWKGILPRLDVTIVGENYLTEEIDTISSLLQHEQDPARRAYLLDIVYAAKGIPAPPEFVQATQPASGGALLPEESSSFQVREPADEPVS